MPTTEFYGATGRRKTAIARVRLVPSADSVIRVNERSLEEYFPQDTLRARVMRPFLISDRKGFSVDTRVDGGGISAQAGAIAHGISRALLKVEAELRGGLKKEGLLTRDPRMKERKKYGQKGARKRFQFSKR